MPSIETLDAAPPHNPPTSRIGTASNASGLCFDLIQADQLRSQYRTKIKGQYDGNAPYSRAELQSKGLGSSCNLNFKEASAIINQFKSPYYDLAVEVPMLANVITGYGSVLEKDDWGQIISEEFDRMVKGWSNWDYIEQAHQFQMLLMGSAICYFHDKNDWRPDVAKAGEFLVPDGTRSNLDELEVIVILKNYASHQLYRYIRNEEQARLIGWNIEATTQAIIDAYNGTGQPPQQVNAFEWYQQMLKNADLYYGSTQSKPVYVAHELVAEFNGRVSHHMVRADQSSDEFIYSNIDRFDSMSDVICPFFYDIGDGTWHSIRGLGYDIFPYCEIFNRLRGREVDGAMISASILFQQASADSVTKSQLLNIQNLGIIPQGLNMLQTNIAQGIQATSEVRRDMAEGLFKNIGSMQPAPGEANPRVGQELGLARMQQSAQIGKGNINRYYTNRDHLLATMYKRASNPNVREYHPGGKMAMEFQRRCILRGVPIEAIVQVDSVKAMRSIGAGSAANGMMVAQAIMEHAQSYPEQGRELAIRDWISRFAGATAAERYMGPMVTRRSTDDEWEATIENNALRTGGEVIITMLQSNVIHLQVHLGDMQQHVAQVQQDAAVSGMNMNATQSLLIHLDAGNKHSLDHLKLIQNDPLRANDFQVLYKSWQQLTHIQDQTKQQLEQMIQKQQQEQPQNGAIDPAELLKKIDYKVAPEGQKIALEQAAGLPARQPGELSVSAQNVLLKKESLNLKEQQQIRKANLEEANFAHRLITTPIKTETAQ